MQLLGNSTGNTYALDQNGNIIRTNKELNTKTNKQVSGILSRLVETIITNDSRNTEFNFTKAGDPLNKSILFDSYNSATIDVGDYKKIKSKPLMAALLAHPIAEYMNSPGVPQRTNATYKPAHDVATNVESAIIYEMNGSRQGTYGTRTNPFYQCTTRAV